MLNIVELDGMIVQIYKH